MVSFTRLETVGLPPAFILFKKRKHMQTWQLPEYIADILPATARQVESAKETFLELFRVHGFELVSPPLIEYTTSLMAESDVGLSLKTIRVVDQLTGLQLGLRADITPQVARIDAHLLSTKAGVNRFCYAGSVLHARPDGLFSTREPIQVGAELYGFAGVGADIEIIALMLKTLQSVTVQSVYLSLGHIGVFRALAEAAELLVEDSHTLLAAMQSKDKTQVTAIIQALHIPDELAQAFLKLPELYGGIEILVKAREVLPPLADVQAALASLETVCDYFIDQHIHIDFAELRVDSYHTGLLFAAYAPGWSDAIARGGRYDNLGAIFGRGRPATGFSLDLRDLIRILPHNQIRLGIKVAVAFLAETQEKIAELRAEGESVVVDYLGQSAESLNCNRELVFQQGCWQVQPSA